MSNLITKHVCTASNTRQFVVVVDNDEISYPTNLSVPSCFFIFYGKKSVFFLNECEPVAKLRYKMEV